jgi:hypothetical protein
MILIMICLILYLIFRDSNHIDDGENYTYYRNDKTSHRKSSGSGLSGDGGSFGDGLSGDGGSISKTGGDGGKW